MESYNHFPQTAAALHRALSRIVSDVAKGIQKEAIQQAPVDTGFLRASIYTVTAKGSTYGKGRTGQYGGKPSVAKALYQELLPEIDASENDLTAYVAVGASYGVYVNYGTRFQPAQPFWEPAVEKGKTDLDIALGRIESQIQANLQGSVEVSEV